MRGDKEDTLMLAIKSINKLRAELVLTLSNGGCSSFEHYKSLTGRIKGYDDCLKIIGESLEYIQTRD